MRLFPDYAGSVIWFSDPLPYAETFLTADLVEQLERWEDSYYTALDEDLRWRPTHSLHEFSARGLELAHLVAAELGPRFSVEYRSFEAKSAVALVRSDHPASNPAAEAAFIARADRARDEWTKSRARLEADPDTAVGWYARSPRSGAIFKLHDHDS